MTLRSSNAEFFSMIQDLELEVVKQKAEIAKAREREERRSRMSGHSSVVIRPRTPGLAPHESNSPEPAISQPATPAPRESVSAGPVDESQQLVDDSSEMS